MTGITILESVRVNEIVLREILLLTTEISVNPGELKAEAGGTRMVITIIN